MLGSYLWSFTFAVCKSTSSMICLNISLMYDFCRTLPLHDSHMITAVRLGAYMNSIGSIRAWYDEKHRNIIAIDGEESKWKIWNSTLIEVKAIVKKIQIYLERIAQGLVNLLLNTVSFQTFVRCRKPQENFLVFLFLSHINNMLLCQNSR